MRSSLVIALCVLLTSWSRALADEIPQPSPSPAVVEVDIDPDHTIQTIRPLEALGGTVDKEPADSISRLYSKTNVRQMLAAGYGWLSYRLFTELSVQDWHWNPRGSFSERSAGYWTSSASAHAPSISDSFGYRLPHSGFTSDQGNNEGYSRLDDGDLRTYWKSNPYLARRFTGDPDSEHPQWVVVDLQDPHRLNAARIWWAKPYAVDYDVQYWTGDDAINDPATGDWQTFPWAHRRDSRGGTQFVRLANGAIVARFIRVLMWRSSNTCDTHGGADIRNCVGYGIAEIGVGRVDHRGRFTDYVRHVRCGGEKPGKGPCGWRQTATYVSSVDPWHSAADRVRNQEQPGLDLIARSGLTRGVPAMYPVPMLYSTPQNAVNEISYLSARGYRVGYVELGEEPDGQYVTPEDDAALYVQWARAIHRRFPGLKLGGPVFSGVNSELQTWPDRAGNVSWLNRFLNYLQSHGAMNELSFMSFEHYPFGGCEHGVALQRDLLQEPSIMKGIVNTWRSDGVPPTVPLFISEAGFSSVNFTQVPMQIEGALWEADYMATALTDGVHAVVYYQYEPVPLSANRDCPGDWGNLTMFVADQHARIRSRNAQFYAAKVLTGEWLPPGDDEQRLHPASSNLLLDGYPLITVYAVERSDGVWSLLIINKDSQSHQVRINFVDPRFGDATGFWGQVIRVTYGSEQYTWRRRGEFSSPDPAAPPLKTILSRPYQGPYDIPARSLTVLRGRVSGTRSIQ